MKLRYASCIVITTVAASIWVGVTTRGAEMRTWTAAEGKATVRAEFVGVAGDIVTLRREGGRELRVPLSKLSPDDVQFVRHQQAADSPSPPTINDPDDRRLAPPTGVALAEARKKVREIFADELKARSAKPRHALALKMHQLTKKLDADDPIGRYALLAEAADLAASAGDPVLALAILDDVVTHYAVGEGLALKLAALESLQKTVASRSLAKSGAVACLKLLDLAETKHDFDAANSLGQVAAAMATKARDPQLTRLVTKRRQKVVEVLKAASRYREAVAVLKTQPTDAAAHVAAGTYLCFVMDDWTKGLRHLARGGDATLAAAAKADLAGPTTAQGLAATADLWWEAAATGNYQDRGAMKRRALAAYEKALPGITGLAKIKATRRLKAAETSRNGTPVTSLKLLGYTGLIHNDRSGSTIRPVDFGGKKYEMGIYGHPNGSGLTQTAVLLGKKYEVLVGACGIGGRGGSANPVVFQIIGDRRVLWTSPPMSKNTETQEFKIVVRGVKNLYFATRAVNQGKSVYGAHAAWGELKVFEKQ
jgi:hypothetical protein